MKSDDLNIGDIVAHSYKSFIDDTKFLVGTVYEKNMDMVYIVWANGTNSSICGFSNYVVECEFRYGRLKTIIV